MGDIYIDFRDAGSSVCSATSPVERKGRREEEEEEGAAVPAEESAAVAPEVRLHETPALRQALDDIAAVSTALDVGPTGSGKVPRPRCRLSVAVRSEWTVLRRVCLGEASTSTLFDRWELSTTIRTIARCEDAEAGRLLSRFHLVAGVRVPDDRTRVRRERLRNTESLPAPPGRRSASTSTEKEGTKTAGSTILTFQTELSECTWPLVETDALPDAPSLTQWISSIGRGERPLSERARLEASKTARVPVHCDLIVSGSGREANHRRCATTRRLESMLADGWPSVSACLVTEKFRNPKEKTCVFRVSVYFRCESAPVDPASASVDVCLRTATDVGTRFGVVTAETSGCRIRFVPGPALDPVESKHPFFAGAFAGCTAVPLCGKREWSVCFEVTLAGANGLPPRIPAKIDLWHRGNGEVGVRSPFLEVSDFFLARRWGDGEEQVAYLDLRGLPRIEPVVDYASRVAFVSTVLETRRCAE